MLRSAPRDMSSQTDGSNSRMRRASYRSGRFLGAVVVGLWQAPFNAVLVPIRSLGALSRTETPCQPVGRWDPPPPPPPLEWGVDGSAAARGITFFVEAPIAFGEVVLVPVKESLRGWEEKFVEYDRKMMGVSDDECGLAEQRSLFKSLKSAHGVLCVFEGEDENEAYFRKQPRGRDCPLANGDAESFGTKGTGTNIAMVEPYAATVLLLAFERHVVRVCGGNPLPVNTED